MASETALAGAHPMLLQQLEATFSGRNETLDRFLKTQMDADSFVDVSLIANLREIKAIVGDVSQVVAALRSVDWLEVDSAGTRVRPKNVPQHTQQQLQATAGARSRGGSASGQQQQSARGRSTVIIRDVPSTTPPAAIQGLFESTPLASAIVELDETGNGNWSITFDSDTNAALALEHLRTAALAGRPVHARLQAPQQQSAQPAAASFNAGSSSRNYFYPGFTDSRASAGLPPHHTARGGGGLAGSASGAGGAGGVRLNRSCNGSFTAGAAPSKHGGAPVPAHSREGNGALSASSSSANWRDTKGGDGRRQADARPQTGRHSAGGYRDAKEELRNSPRNKLSVSGEVDMNATWPPPAGSPAKEGDEGDTGAVDARGGTPTQTSAAAEKQSSRRSRPSSRTGAHKGATACSSASSSAPGRKAEAAHTLDVAGGIPTTATVHRYSPEELLAIYAQMNLDHEPSNDFFGDDVASAQGSGSERESPEPPPYEREREAEHATKDTGVRVSARPHKGAPADNRPRLYKGSRSSSDLLEKTRESVAASLPPRPQSQQRMAPANISIVISGGEQEDTDDGEGDGERPDSRASMNNDGEGDDGTEEEGAVGPDGKKKKRAGKSRSGSRRHRMKRKPSAAHMESVKERLIKDASALNARSPNSKAVGHGLAATFHSGLNASFGVQWPSRESGGTAAPDGQQQRADTRSSVAAAPAGVEPRDASKHSTATVSQRLLDPMAKPTRLEQFKAALDASEYDYDSNSSDGGGAYGVDDEEDDRLNMTM